MPNQLLTALRSLGFLSGRQSWILGTLLGRMDSGQPMHEPERDELEGRLQATMLVYFDGQYKRLAELMTDGVADPDWDYEQQLAAEFMFPDITATHQLGALAGGLAVSGVGIDWGLVNESAVDWARKHTLSVSGQITDTTRERYALVRDEVAEDIAAWIEEGDPLPKLIKTLETKMPAHRAEMVAVTETTRAFAEANTNAWEMSGEVEGRRWRTAQDERVCEICQGLSGQVAKLGVPLVHPVSGLKYDNPPAHVRCRCAVTPEIIRLPGEVVEEPVTQPAQPWKQVAGTVPVGEDTTTRRMHEYLVQGLKPEDVRWKDWELKPAHRAKAKSEIVDALMQRTGLPADDIDNFIGQWARSSNDDDMRSLAIQKAASELFGIPMSEFTQGKIDGLLEQLEVHIEPLLHPISGPPMFNTRAEALGYLQASYAGQHQKLFSLLPDEQQKTLLQAMYDNTQERLAEAGFGPGDTIRMRRGVKLPLEDTTGWRAFKEVEIEGNPLESWSTSQTTASDFARQPGQERAGVIFEMDVPIELIMGSARSGFGCLAEDEFILFGSFPNKAKILRMYR